MKKCSDQFDLNSFFSLDNDFKGCMKIFQEGNKEFEIQNLFKLKPSWKLALLYNEAFLSEQEEVNVLLVFL